MCTVYKEIVYFSNDPYVANKVISGKQCTIYWCVDDTKVSHEGKIVVD